MNDFIQLKKDNIIKIGIKDSEGNELNEHLEFDLEDIELPLKIQKCEEMHKRNVNYIKMQFAVIDKKQDKKGKKLLSANEEEKIKLMNEFYKREMEALDLFLGENGTNKLLNGRKPYYSMYEDINEMLEPIMPIIQDGFKKIGDKIKRKYSNISKENVLR